MLRRTAPREPHANLYAGAIPIDLHRRHVSVGGELVSLSNTEYRVCALAAEPTRVFTRTELMRAAWN